MLAYVKLYIDQYGWDRYARSMKDKLDIAETGTWIVRNIPSDLMRRTRMAALAERKTVRQLLIELVEGRLSDLEKKGLMPKAKG